MKTSTFFLVLALIAWLGATAVAALSERTYGLMDDIGMRSLYSDRGPATALNWTDKTRRGFSCMLLQSSGIRYCGMNVQLGDGVRQGIDFADYSKLRLEVEYKGPAEKFRVYVRNGIPDINFADSKYQQVDVPVRRGAYIYEIPFDTFEVADWWIESAQVQNIPEFRIPSRDNLVHIGFDVSTPIAVGQHYFNITEFSVVAPWLGKTNRIWWAIGSLLYFIVTGLLYNFFRLRIQLKEHHDEMFGLLKKLQEAGTESAHFKRLSMYDPLTGLLNRRAALDLVDQFAQHNSLTGTALVVMDIDHFKQVNDSHGHEIGDEVLKRVSAVVQHAVREGDAAVRWGGEEIVVICPKTNADGAVRVAEKLRAEIKHLAFSVPGLTITASFGVANIRHGESFSQALGRADEALYEAKKNGRDQVRGHKTT
ncbi:MAG: GGDEF domain-containing protein [Cellvibrionaceae bacterium]|nr:GGDEF domain-containing protein [Cellvibrionaceae bacterium]